MNERLKIGTSFEGEPEHHNCLFVHTGAAVSNNLVSPPAVSTGAPSTLCSSLDAPHSPCIVTIP